MVKTVMWASVLRLLELMSVVMATTTPMASETGVAILVTAERVRAV
jgi:hypothetical protein